MFRNISFAGIVTVLCAFIAPHVDTYKLDTSKSTLEWTGKQITKQHSGIVKLLSGELKNDHGMWSGRFEADMTTIESTDLQGSSKERLEKHLKSADFFEVETYPKAVFELLSITPFAAPKDDGSTHLVKGKFTIKDQTNEEQFDAMMKDFGNGAIQFTGTATFDRAKYNVRYGSKAFFADIGDKMIYDEIPLRFSVVVQK